MRTVRYINFDGKDCLQEQCNAPWDYGPAQLFTSILRAITDLRNNFLNSLRSSVIPLRSSVRPLRSSLMVIRSSVMVLRSSVRGIAELRNELTEFIFLIRTLTRHYKVPEWLRSSVTSLRSSATSLLSSIIPLRSSVTKSRNSETSLRSSVTNFPVLISSHSPNE